MAAVPLDNLITHDSSGLQTALQQILQRLESVESDVSGQKEALEAFKVESATAQRGQQRGDFEASIQQPPPAERVVTDEKTSNAPAEEKPSTPPKLVALEQSGQPKDKEASEEFEKAKARLDKWAEQLTERVKHIEATTVEGEERRKLMEEVERGREELKQEVQKLVEKMEDKVRDLEDRVETIDEQIIKHHGAPGGENAAEAPGTSTRSGRPSSREIAERLTAEIKKTEKYFEGKLQALKEEGSLRASVADAGMPALEAQVAFLREKLKDAEAKISSLEETAQKSEERCARLESEQLRVQEHLAREADNSDTVAPLPPARTLRQESGPKSGDRSTPPRPAPGHAELEVRVAALERKADIVPVIQTQAADDQAPIRTRELESKLDSLQTDLEALKHEQRRASTLWEEGMAALESRQQGSGGKPDDGSLSESTSGNAAAAAEAEAKSDAKDLTQSQASDGGRKETTPPSAVAAPESFRRADTNSVGPDSQTAASLNELSKRVKRLAERHTELQATVDTKLKEQKTGMERKVETQFDAIEERVDFLMTTVEKKVREADSLRKEAAAKTEKLTAILSSTAGRKLVEALGSVDIVQALQETAQSGKPSSQSVDELAPVVGRLDEASEQHSSKLKILEKRIEKITDSIEKGGFAAAGAKRRSRRSRAGDADDEEAALAEEILPQHIVEDKVQTAVKQFLTEHQARLQGGVRHMLNSERQQIFRVVVDAFSKYRKLEDWQEVSFKNLGITAETLEGKVELPEIPTVAQIDDMRNELEDLRAAVEEREDDSTDLREQLDEAVEILKALGGALQKDKSAQFSSALDGVLSRIGKMNGGQGGRGSMFAPSTPTSAQRVSFYGGPRPSSGLLNQTKEDEAADGRDLPKGFSFTQKAAQGGGVTSDVDVKRLEDKIKELAKVQAKQQVKDREMTTAVRALQETTKQLHAFLDTGETGGDARRKKIQQALALHSDPSADPTAGPGEGGGGNNHQLALRVSSLEESLSYIQMDVLPRMKAEQQRLLSESSTNALELQHKTAQILKVREECGRMVEVSSGEVERVRKLVQETKESLRRVSSEVITKKVDASRVDMLEEKIRYLHRSIFDNQTLLARELSEEAVRRALLNFEDKMISQQRQIDTLAVKMQRAQLPRTTTAQTELSEAGERSTARDRDREREKEGGFGDGLEERVEGVDGVDQLLQRQSRTKVELNKLQDRIMALESGRDAEEAEVRKYGALVKSLQRLSESHQDHFKRLEAATVSLTDRVTKAGDVREALRGLVEEAFPPQMRGQTDDAQPKSALKGGRAAGNSQQALEMIKSLLEAPQNADADGSGSLSAEHRHELMVDLREECARMVRRSELGLSVKLAETAQRFIGKKELQGVVKRVDRLLTLLKDTDAKVSELERLIHGREGIGALLTKAVKNSCASCNREVEEMNMLPSPPVGWRKLPPRETRRRASKPGEESASTLQNSMHTLIAGGSEGRTLGYQTSHETIAGPGSASIPTRGQQGEPDVMAEGRGLAPLNVHTLAAAPPPPIQQQGAEYSGGEDSGPEGANDSAQPLQSTQYQQGTTQMGRGGSAEELSISPHSMTVRDGGPAGFRGPKGSKLASAPLSGHPPSPDRAHPGSQPTGSAEAGSSGALPMLAGRGAVNPMGRTAAGFHLTSTQLLAHLPTNWRKSNGQQQQQGKPGGEGIQQMGYMTHR